MDYSVSHRPDRFESIQFREPIDQETRCRFMVGGDDTAAVLSIPGGFVAPQISSAQADAINRSRQIPLQRFANLVQRELDA